MFNEAVLSDYDVKINGVSITTVRYANDMVRLSDTTEGHRKLLNRINRIGKRFGLNMNVDQTNFITFSQTTYNNTMLQGNGAQIENV